MKVLVLGSDSPLGQALAFFLEQTRRHKVTLLPRSACRWKSERQAKKAMRREPYATVVDCRLEAQADGGESIHESELTRCYWTARACQRNQSSYLFISTSRVFSGTLERRYTEFDYPDCEDDPGEILAVAEQVVRDNCERHCILRLGPVFGYAGSNLVSGLLDVMTAGGKLVLDNSLRGCPVPADDGARVISAILDQLSTGIEPWGIYHYCSSDSATYYEFAEALLAAASQFRNLDSAMVELERERGKEMGFRRSLDCSKLRSTFAIKQSDWRTALAGIVKDYYENLTESN